MMTDQHQRDNQLEGYPAEKARQGFIVLRTPLRRFIFIAGLAGMVVVVIVVGLLT